MIDDSYSRILLVRLSLTKDPKGRKVTLEFQVDQVDLDYKDRKDRLGKMGRMERMGVEVLLVNQEKMGKIPILP